MTIIKIDGFEFQLDNSDWSASAVDPKAQMIANELNEIIPRPHQTIFAAVSEKFEIEVVKLKGENVEDALAGDHPQL